MNIDLLVRAAYLSKTDLLTNMMRDGKEFTKLEGIIGREYARAAGEPKRVCEAIYEQYLPKSSVIACLEFQKVSCCHLLTA